VPAFSVIWCAEGKGEGVLCGAFGQFLKGRMRGKGGSPEWGRKNVSIGCARFLRLDPSNRYRGDKGKGKGGERGEGLW